MVFLAVSCKLHETPLVRDLSPERLVTVLCKHKFGQDVTHVWSARVGCVGHIRVEVRLTIPNQQVETGAVEGLRGA